MKKIKYVVLIALIIVLASCSPISDNTGNSNSQKTQETPKADNKLNTSGGKLKVSIIDVGQGDAILIKTPGGKFVLVDSGSSKESDKFFNYLSGQKVKSLSAVVGTHPHEDHIGNLNNVILKYDVQNLYLPKATSNTKTFQKLMDTIKGKGMKIKTAKSGVKFNIDGIDFEFVAPNSGKYEKINNYSAVLKITYKNNSFILMGDAEKLSEKEILKNGANITAQVIKIGHHGSTSSSSKELLERVNPSYAVVSCGKNNDYGHPHKETLKMLNDRNIKLYRTDLNGTVSFSSNGEKISVTAENNK